VRKGLPVTASKVVNLWRETPYKFLPVKPLPDMCLTKTRLVVKELRLSRLNVSLSEDIGLSVNPPLVVPPYALYDKAIRAAVDIFPKSRNSISMSFDALTS